MFKIWALQNVETNRFATQRKYYYFINGGKNGIN
jgi:hypothetical protein